jgi:hypothetical protein
MRTAARGAEALQRRALALFITDIRDSAHGGVEERRIPLRACASPIQAYQALELQIPQSGFACLIRIIARTQLEQYSLGIERRH